VALIKDKNVNYWLKSALFGMDLSITRKKEVGMELFSPPTTKRIKKLKILEDFQ